MKHYWAVRPTSMPDQVRIEHAMNGTDATRAAFGREVSPKHEVGRWQAKDLGTRVALIQSESKRLALLQSPRGWFDPYASPSLFSTGPSLSDGVQEVIERLPPVHAGRNTYKVIGYARHIAPDIEVLVEDVADPEQAIVVAKLKEPRLKRYSDVRVFKREVSFVRVR